jgi:GNAT superfamily N-acetyltransferase
MATVANLTADQVPVAARLLARAFAADPIITHFLDGFLRRQIAFPAFFRAIIREHLEGGHVYSARDEGRLIGVSVWSPPKGVTRSDQQLKALADRDHRIVRAFFPRRSRELYGGFAATASLHPREPHWYLAFVGIDPQFQGKGVGQELLGSVLDAADVHGVPCYLETPFPATHKFYQRLGFEIGTQAKPFPGAPPLWTMARPPRTGRARQFEK